MSVQTRVAELERLAGIRRGMEMVTVCDDDDLQRALALLADGVNVFAMTHTAEHTQSLVDAGAKVLYFAGNISPCDL